MSKNVLLDTSVLIKLYHPKARPEVEKAIKSLRNKEFFTSAISWYEFCRTANNYDQFNEKTDHLNQWKYLEERLEINEDVFKNAIVYYNILSHQQRFAEKENEPEFPQMRKKFSDADIFLGATALTYDLLLCTFNGNDFPRPLFEDTSSTRRIGAEVMSVLKPNISLFEEKLDHLLPLTEESSN